MDDSKEEMVNMMETGSQKDVSEKDIKKAEMRQLVRDILQEDDTIGLLRESLQKMLPEMLPRLLQETSPHEPIANGENSSELEKELQNQIDLLTKERDKFKGDFKQEQEARADDIRRLEAELEQERQDRAEAISRLEGERDGFKVELEQERQDRAEAISRLEGERDGFKVELEQERQDRAEAISRLEGERDGFKAELEQERQARAKDISRLEGERDGFKDKLEQERQARVKDISRLEGERDGFKDKLKKEQKDRVADIKRLEGDLSQRFPEGWSIYQKFLALPKKDRERVANYLYSEDFASFITSGSQVGNLESIWTKILETKRDGSESATTLWEVFRYCVRLVNVARGKELIRILEPNIGDKYDPNKHSTNGTNSSAQGKVQEIILPGFENLVKKRIEQKSNVRVG